MENRIYLILSDVIGRYLLPLAKLVNLNLEYVKVLPIIFFEYRKWSERKWPNSLT